ncbi:hypothetical protein GCM10022225_62460 [Plantactinospora mayteni]|uniref:Uncharacterized protein n=1 Tax=Plantactinospora mayteni TaxID=566021 RepID=A0ABQ4EZE1_9ACTN|nr:hypothetical protein Pma05_65840 [Plantactinospora mayteni]
MALSAPKLIEKGWIGGVALVFTSSPVSVAFRDTVVLSLQDVKGSDKTAPAFTHPHRPPPPATTTAAGGVGGVQDSWRIRASGEPKFAKDLAIPKRADSAERGCVRA